LPLRKGRWCWQTCPAKEPVEVLSDRRFSPGGARNCAAACCGLRSRSNLVASQSGIEQAPRTVSARSMGVPLDRELWRWRA